MSKDRLELLSPQHECLWGTPEDVFSGEICEAKAAPSIFKIWISSGSGIERIYGVRQSELFSDEMRIVETFKKLREFREPRLLRWPSDVRQVTYYISTNLENPPVASEYPRHKSSQNRDRLILAPDDNVSNERLLELLSNTRLSLPRRRALILEAEVRDFGGVERESIVPLLFEFIERYRFVDEEESLIAVSAAIRKSALNMNENEFDRYAALFDPTSTESVPCEVELELTKASVWRLTFELINSNSLGVELAKRLEELAENYLKPRLIVQKNFAAIALNAVVGLVLIPAFELKTVKQLVNELNISWFSDHIVNRLEQIENALVQSSVEGVSVLQRLESFRQQIEQLVP